MPDKLYFTAAEPAFDRASVKGIPAWTGAPAADRERLATYWRATALSWGIVPVEIPLVEEHGLFAHAIGADSDIVHKEMFRVADPKDRHQWVLRPEGTASVVRSRVAAGQAWQDARCWYMGPMFRYERPQKGRLRQFTQFGVESFAADTLAEDILVLQLGQELLDFLPADAYTLEIGSLGCDECRPQYRAALVAYLAQRSDSLCDDCRRRTQSNPLRVLDCKVPACREQLAEAPSMQDHLCASCRGRQDATVAALDAAGITFKLNRRLVRGLDYYNGLVFEWVTDKLGAQGAIAAGGRYNKLALQYGREEIPAIGFAMGMERVLELAAVTVPRTENREFGLLWLQLDPHSWDAVSSNVLHHVRRLIPVEIDTTERSLKSKMRSANRSQWRWLAAVGSNELSDGRIRIKDMQEGTEEEVTLDNLAAWALAASAQRS